MRAALALVGLLTLSVSPALAQPDICAVPNHLLQDGAAILPRAEAALRDGKKLDVLVVGTGSSALSNPSGAYPARLEAALAERLPGVHITITTDVQSRRTCGEMARSFGRLLAHHKPVLVIWQTGTYDAMRGVSPEDFNAELIDGIDGLQAAGVDVVLMNMQYSPRTESMISAVTYAENMRWVAQQRQVPLFDRLNIMRYWSEQGVFDLSAAADKGKTAERVHGCIGKLLADLILETVRPAGDQSKAGR